LRPGEKLFEELFLGGEDYGRTCHEKIFTAANGNHSVLDDLEEGLGTLQAAAARNDRQAILHGLQNLVPEFEVMTIAGF
jgi:FlaA1/EpsC-like NDP-sugar epimerase